MRNTIIATIFLFIAVIGASLYYFTNLNEKKTETLRPLTFLPEETFFIATFQNDITTDNVFKDFDIFGALVGHKELEQWQKIKKVFLRHSTLEPYVNGVNQYISFHPESGSITPLFVVPVVSSLPSGVIRSFFAETAEGFSMTQKDTLENTIYSLDPGVKDSTVHILYYQDVFFTSFSDSLLYKVLDERVPKLDEKEINYFVDNNSRNSPFSIYFVHEQIPRLAEHLMRRQAGSFIKLFDNLGGQSAWNLSFKNDALILSGESKIEEGRNSYLELFSEQRKTSQSLYQYFPEYTASYLSFALSDPFGFQKDLLSLLKLRDELTPLEVQFRAMEKSTGVSFDEDIHPVFGREFALVEQSNQTELAFISVADSSKIDALIASIASKVSDSIYRFNYSNIPFALYGDPLKPFTRPYFLRIENVLVLANYQSLLAEYRHNWKNKNLLTNTLGFKNSERIQGNEANVTCFVRTSTSSSIISSVLKARYRKKFRSKTDYGYQDFYSWSIQIAGNNGSFQSSIYAVYKNKDALGATPEWVYAFNNRPITAPQVFEHSDTSQFILIQEQDHTIHAISPKGDKLWSTVLHGRIVGETQQLGDRSIVLVTDRNQLYRFDPEGNAFPGFSFVMDSEPTYSPTIETIGGLQLIFVPAGRKLLVYTLEGKKAEGWSDVPLNGRILFDIKAHNDQVFLGTENGHFYQFNARGKLLGEEQVAEQAFKNPITLVGHEQSQPSLYAVDTSGISYTMNFRDKAKVFKLERGDNQPLVSYFPAADGLTDQVTIINRNQLWIKNLHDNSSLLEHIFTQEITERPQYFKNSSSGYFLGVASRKNELVYLFDPNGSIPDGFPVSAQPGFYYGKIDYNSATYLLCVRRDRKLYAFKH